jgi:hypothetical protein
MISKNTGHNIINAPNTPNIHILVQGNNNTITISPDMPATTSIDLVLYGDDNIVQIGTIDRGNVHICMGYGDGRKICRAKFITGDNNRMNGVSFLMLEDDTRIIIGDNNRFSDGVDIRCTDDHSVLDENGNVLNRAESIIIGNGNWITRGVTILKNTVLLNESAIGTRSVFTRKMDKSNVIICGNPARVVRENIKLDRERPDWYARRHSGNTQNAPSLDLCSNTSSAIGRFEQNICSPMHKHTDCHMHKVKFLGIPFFKKKIKNNKVKYYILGIHLVTVVTK